MEKCEIYQEEPYHSLFSSLENKIKSYEQVNAKKDSCKKICTQINFFFLDQLFDDLYNEFENEESVEKFSYSFGLAKKAIEYYHNINYLYLFFYQLSKDLMIPNERRIIIINLLKKWSQTTFPNEKKIYKYKKPSFQELNNEAHNLWLHAITKNIQLKKELDDITSKAINSLNERTDRSTALVRSAFKKGNRKDEDNNERRYMKFASDLMYVIDTMNNDIENDYKMPDWDD